MTNVPDVLKGFAERNGYDYSNDEEGAYERWKGICINIGAGSFSHPRWTNLDVSSSHYKGVQPAGFVEYDLTKHAPLPFKDNAVALAYCSHAVEHIKDDGAKKLFREVCRALKPGGVFRITCPNADLFYYAARMNNFSAFNMRSNFWFKKVGLSPAEAQPIDFLVKAVATELNRTHKFLRDINPQLAAEANRLLETMSKEDFLDWLTGKVEFSIDRIGCHINWWNFSKFKELLTQAGFSAVFPSSFGGSIAAPLRNTLQFDKTVPEESIYIDAVKF